MSGGRWVVKELFGKTWLYHSACLTGLMRRDEADEDADYVIGVWPKDEALRIRDDRRTKVDAEVKAVRLVPEVSGTMNCHKCDCTYPPHCCPDCGTPTVTDEEIDGLVDAYTRGLADGMAQGRREGLVEAAAMLDDQATADAGWAKRMDEDGDQPSALVHRVAVEVRRADAARIRALVKP